MSAGELNFPQDIYARNLVSHRGYPLWSPEPHIELPDSYQQGGLKIGDIGVVVPEDGSFDVFLNITLPREHALHARNGVPDNFRQVEMGRDDYRIAPDAENPGRVIVSSGVECRDANVESFNLDGNSGSMTEHPFGLYGNEGAMLILPEGAERHVLAKELLLLDHVIENAVGWYQFARERLYRNISNDALYLITGFHKASSWSLASFRNTAGGPTSARCRLVQSTDGGPLLTQYSTWKTVRPLEWRIGPRIRRFANPNQSVFITGFKITVNQELLHLKRVTVKVGHTERTLASKLVGFGSGFANFLVGEASEDTHNSDAATRDATGGQTAAEDTADAMEHDPITVERVPYVSQPFHPSDVINRFLLKAESSAEVAVTHDNQWIALLENGLLTQEELVQEECLTAAIFGQYNKTFRNGAVFLERKNIVAPVRRALPFHHAANLPKDIWRALLQNEAAANVILPLAKKALDFPREGNQLWIALYDDANRVEFVLSCTNGHLGNYPIFIVATKSSAQIAQDEKQGKPLANALLPLARCLLDEVPPQRVFSVFSIARVTETFATIFEAEAHGRLAHDIRVIKQPYYDATFTFCTSQTLKDPAFTSPWLDSVAISLCRADMSHLDSVKAMCKGFSETLPPFVLDDARAELEAIMLITNKQAWVHIIQEEGQMPEIACLVATTRESDNVTVVTKIFVEQAWRGRGCASRLLHHVCQENLRMKERVVLYISNSDMSAPARRVLAKIGFQGLNTPYGQEVDDMDRWLEIGFEGTTLGHW